MDLDRENDAAYYRNRAEMQRVMADQAPTDAIRTIHSQLAERYAALADAIDGSSFAGSSSAQAPDENAPKGATTAA
jgi:hypothetical protein